MVHTVYHLSDLHIRSGDATKCRYNEYNYVFKKFVDYLKVQSHLDKSVLVITGDLFHHKSKLESPGIKLFYDFLQEVGKLLPIYIIRGTHDYKQWETNEVDLISSMLIPGISNVTYLNTSGVYRVDSDLGFGLLAVQDQQNASFPLASGLDTRWKIALFHGLVENNTRFQGYDAALLGDVHIQMVNGCDMCVGGEDTDHCIGVHCVGSWSWKQDSCPFGYASSMVRQTVSESIEGHGFLKWNLATRTVAAYHIDNIVDLAAAECEALLFDKKNTCTSTKMSDEDIDRDGDNENHSTPFKNTLDMWIDYIENNGGIQNAGLLVKNPELLLLDKVTENEVIQNKVLERNNKIKKRLDAFGESLKEKAANCQKSPFRFLKMTWDWLLCFGADNQFYFNKLDGKISTISGRNGHGKTSFLEIILLALYGTGFPSRSNRHHSSSVISINKPRNAPCQVTLTLSVENVGMIRLFRAFYHPDDKKSLQSTKNVKVEVWDPDVSLWNPCVSGKVAVDKWVSSNIGSMEGFLLSCMVSQNADADFFSMTPSEQKEMLDNALCIDTHTRYMELLKESRLAHQNVADLVNSSISLLTRQLHEEHANNANRIAILDKHIGDAEATNYGMGDLQEKEYYIQIITDLESQEQYRSVDDIIFELEGLKRAGSGKSFANANIEYEKPLSWYETELADHLMLSGLIQIGQGNNTTVDLDVFDMVKDQVFSLGLDRIDDDCGFDKGPYNEDCECCLQRMDKRKGRELLNWFFTLWHAKKKYLENSILGLKYNKISELQLELAEAKVREKNLNQAKYVVDNYNDIVKSKQISKLIMEKARLCQELEVYNRVMAEKEVYFELQQTLSQKLKIISNVQSCLEGYISWLYQENVIPLVERYTNEVMNLLDPNLKLKGWMTDGGKGFDWSITQSSQNIDTDYYPHIEKASGFQRFICGLAIRIALGNIGAAGIKPRQLFLDEGFTSCDAENLAHVPDFLRVLLQVYDSILLVTHLEELKDFCIDSSIDIRRDVEAGTSQIRM